MNASFNKRMQVITLAVTIGFNIWLIYKMLLLIELGKLDNNSLLVLMAGQFMTLLLTIIGKYHRVQHTGDRTVEKQE